MLRSKKSTLGLVGLALAVPATALLLISPPQDANAKRFSFSKSKSDSHSTPSTSKHHENGDAASTSAKMKDGSDNPSATAMSANPQNAGDGSAPDAGETKKAVAARPTSAPPKQHLLSAAHPGMDVVVCAAGCTNSNETEQAVYVQVSTARTAKTVGEFKPTSSEAAAAEDLMKNMIRCLGGCYDTPKIYRSTQATSDMIAAVTSGASVVPLNAKPVGSGSGAWLRRIDANRGFATDEGGPGGSPASQAPSARKTNRDTPH